MEHLFSFPASISVLFFIFILLTTWKKSKTTSSATLPPGPRRLPIIGNMHQLLGSELPHYRMKELAKKYGPIMHLQLGEISNVVISSAEIAKEILKTHEIIFAERPFNLSLNVIAYNSSDIAFAPYGDYWRQVRKICILELLSAKRVQSFRTIREEEVFYFIKSLSSCAGSPVNLTRMLVSLTNCITSRTAFGKLRKQEEAFTPLITDIVEVQAGFSVADFFPSLKFLHVMSGMMRRIMRLHRETDEVLEEIINEHKARRGTTTVKAGSRSEADDLVDVLLNLQEHGNLEFPLTTDNIKAVILDMFLGGSETSSRVVEWAISELVKNPRVLEKAQAEVRQVFKGKESIYETSLQELNYLDLILKETLRLHPPAPLLVPREAREDAEVAGYVIPAKTKVFINAWAISVDPQYWHEPDRFNPERFVDSSIDYKGTHFEYIPFGAGRRICPGMLYGMSVAELTLANLLYHFDWKLPEAMQPEDLDMSEAYGATARRKIDLCLVPIPYHSLHIKDDN